MTQPFEPYAPPRAAPPEPPLAAPGRPLSWEPGEVLVLAWARFKRSWFVLVAGYIIVMVISELTSRGVTLAWRLGSTADGASAVRRAAIAGSVAVVVSFGVSTYLMVGLLRVWLDAARGRTPSFGTLFLGSDRFLPMLALQFVVTLAMLGGFLLLIVPGIIVGLGLSFAPFYLVDANLGPVEAIRASWAATKGQKGKLFALGVHSLFVLLLGLFALVVGVFASISVVYVAFAIAYTRVSGREATLPDPAPGRVG